MWGIGKAFRRSPTGRHRDRCGGFLGPSPPGLKPAGKQFLVVGGFICRSLHDGVHPAAVVLEPIGHELGNQRDPHRVVGLARAVELAKDEGVHHAIKRQILSDEGLEPIFDDEAVLDRMPGSLPIGRLDPIGPSLLQRVAGIAVDGEAYCWGRNEFGYRVVEIGADPVGDQATRSLWWSGSRS